MASDNLVNPLTSIDAEIADRLERDEAFRNDYIRFWAQTEVASQIRQLRKARRKRQTEVARLAGTGQSAISRIEKADYDGWTYKTLIGIAEVLHARLRVKFEPIEDVIKSYRDQSTNTGIVSGGSTGEGADLSHGADTFDWYDLQHGESSAKAVEM